MFKDIIMFLKNISFIDYVFFFTVIFLIILVVSLIYFIKVNEEIIATDETINDPDDLRKIASSLPKEPKPVTFTSYEKEQEEKAIISYDELLSNTGEFKLNYSDEENKGDITVKRFDLNNLATPTIKEIQKTEVSEEPKLLTLKKEEDFLKTLKELKNILS